MKARQVRGWVIELNGITSENSFRSIRDRAWKDFGVQTPAEKMWAMEDGYRCVRATLTLDQPKKGKQ